MAPTAVRNVDLVNRVWPSDVAPRPDVTHFPGDPYVIKTLICANWGLPTHLEPNLKYSLTPRKKKTLRAFS